MSQVRTTFGRFKRMVVAASLLCGGLVITSSSSEVSAVGNTWSAITLPTTQGNMAFPYDGATGDGKVVIVGNETDQNSSFVDTRNIWTATTSSLSFVGQRVGTSIIFNVVEFGNGIFMAAGYDSSNTSTTVVYTSADGGVTWVNRSSGLPSGLRVDMPVDLRFIDGRFWLFANKDENSPNQIWVPVIATTTNGQTWSTQLLGATDFNQSPARAPGSGFDVNGSTIVVASHPFLPSSLSVSTNSGTTLRWGVGTDNPFTINGASAQNAPDYRLVRYGSGKFVAVGWSNGAPSYSATSVDGLSWTEAQAGGINANVLSFVRDFVFTGTEFVIVGAQGFARSTDGVTWTTSPWNSADNSIGASTANIMRYVHSGPVQMILGLQYDWNGYVATGTTSLINVTPAPTVTLVNPSTGVPSGGTSVTIAGTNFASGATVTFGGNACTNVVVVSTTSITCTTPAGSVGSASVVVTVSGQSNSSNSLFSYAAATTTTTTTTTTVPASSGASTPVLVTSANQAQLEADPGEAVAVINGQKVTVETIKVADNATPAQQLATAKEIVKEIASVLPAGATNTLAVVETDEGAEISGLMVNPEDPTEKLNMPVEAVTLVDAGQTKVVISALNQTNLPAEIAPGGIIQVTRGGLVAAQAFGLPASETGEIVLMSTPRLLKTFTVDGSGTYKGQVPLPTDISFGTHTVVLATSSAKVSLGIKLVRTKMQFRIKRTISTRIFKNRAGVKKAGGKVTISGSGRCRANATKVKMSSKAGACYITVRQVAKGKYPAVNYRFTVSVVKKLPKKAIKAKK